jgi:hypothetical protein
MYHTGHERDLLPQQREAVRLSTDPEAARAALRSWRRRRDSVDSDRDGLVLAALRAGLLKEEVHVITGLGRTTIDRIKAAASTEERG